MARASNAGFGVIVDTRAFNRLARDFKRVEPAAYKAAQVALQALGRRTLAQAAENASFSDRIPQSGKVKTRGLNVKVQFGGDAAPDAAPIENRGKGRPRHPLFGNRDYWYVTERGPFLAPAFETSRAEAMKILDEAVFAAMERML